MKKPFFAGISLLLVTSALWADAQGRFELGVAKKKNVKSIEQIRFEGVIEQGLDRSCGLASVATLVSLYWGHQLTEAQIIKEENNKLKDQGIVNLGFISNYLTKIGFENETYDLDFESLRESVGQYAPVIIHYKWPDLHFALALSASNEGVLVADSARGLEFVEKSLFCRRWSGLALFAQSKRDPLQKEFLAKIIGNKTKQRRAMAFYHRRKV